MASGVTVNKRCIDAYTEMKQGKKSRYMILNIVDRSEVDVELVGDRDATFDDFRAKLLSFEEGTQCRYAVFDLEYEMEVQGAGMTKKRKIVFIMWAPDTGKIKDKMLYASSKDAIRKKLDAGLKEVQANDNSDLELSNIMEIVSRQDRH